MTGTARRLDDLVLLYDQRLAGRWRKAPFVLRVTRWAGITGPVLVLKERRHLPADKPGGAVRLDGLMERGHLAGEAQRRVLPTLRGIVERVADEGGVPLELHRFLTVEGLRTARNLPLDEEAGAKLGLIFRLHQRVFDLDRVELIARRVARFTREEAGYWHSRLTSYGPDANRWAAAGMRLMLGGQAKDPAAGRMLDQLRSR